MPEQSAPSAIEAEYYSRKIGTIGDFGCFSFYATREVATGEGGMIISRRSEHIDRARILTLHGMSKDAGHRFSDQDYKHYQVVEAGFKYNMMDIQAALGIHQLARVEANWKRREHIWQLYMQAFADLPVGLPTAAEEGTRHAFHLFTLLLDEDRCGIARDAFLTAMHERGIGTGVHYLSIPEHDYYQQRFDWRPEQWPNAMHAGRQTMSLPLSPKLTNHDVKCVIASVRNTVSCNT